MTSISELRNPTPVTAKKITPLSDGDKAALAKMQVETNFADPAQQEKWRKAVDLALSAGVTIDLCPPRTPIAEQVFRDENGREIKSFIGMVTDETPTPTPTPTPTGDDDKAAGKTTPPLAKTGK